MPPSTTFAGRGPLRGSVPVPGDKSISHRALMVAALAVGESRLHGLCDGRDIEATAAALEAMGARIERTEDGPVSVFGTGTGALLQPQAPLDLGNSGTSARLLLGLAASHNLRTIFTGDSSLSRRPMDRVAAPLRRIGAQIETAAGGGLPLRVEGVAPALPRRHRLTLASAQVKSALLLAGLNIPGLTIVEEAAPTRDHLERLLVLAGAEIESENGVIAVRGETALRPLDIVIAGDPSAAAFLAVAATIVPGSEIRIESVGINPGRTGLYDMLREMGADIEFSDTRIVANEPVADIRVRHAALRGIDVPPHLAPRMIDEFPILFIAAAFADGTTRTSGLAELRVKESDRIAAMADGLGAIGVEAEASVDGLAVTGRRGEKLAGGATIAAQSDHRVAMSFAVAGLHAIEPIGIDDVRCIDTSFPGFAGLIERLTGG